MTEDTSDLLTPVRYGHAPGSILARGKDGRVLRAIIEVEWRDGHVWANGAQLSDEEAAPYWAAVAPFTPEDCQGGTMCVVRRIAEIDYEKRIVTYRLAG